MFLCHFGRVVVLRLSGWMWVIPATFTSWASTGGLGSLVSPSLMSFMPRIFIRIISLGVLILISVAKCGILTAILRLVSSIGLDISVVRFVLSRKAFVCIAQIQGGWFILKPILSRTRSLIKFTMIQPHRWLDLAYPQMISTWQLTMEYQLSLGFTTYQIGRLFERLTWHGLLLVLFGLLTISTW